MYRPHSHPPPAPAAEQRGYKSVFDAFGRIMGEEGFGAFYRGSQPFVMRAMLVVRVRFSVVT